MEFTLTSTGLKQVIFILLSTKIFFFSLLLNAQDINSDDIIVDGSAYNLSREYNNTGYAKLQNGNYAEAKSLFLKAIELDSFDILMYENLAITYQKMSDYDGLVQCYSKAKRIFPNDADVHYYSGDILQNLKRYEEAIKDYDKAIKISNDDKENELLYLYYFNRGNTYLKLKNYGLAIENFNYTLQLNPYHFASFANRGMARFNLKDKNGACSDWNDAKELGHSGSSEYLMKYCR